MPDNEMVVVEFVGGDNLAFDNMQQYENSGFRDRDKWNLIRAKKYNPNEYFTRYKVKLTISDETGVEVENDKAILATKTKGQLCADGFLNAGLVYASAAFGYSDESYEDALQLALNAWNRQ